MSQEALDALLGADINEKREVYIKRLGYLTIKPISGKELAGISDESTTTIGKGKKKHKEQDDLKFGALLIAEACVSPDFANKQLLEKYNASSVDEVVMKALRAGEIATLSREIMDLSGFDNDVEEAVEETKN